LSTSFLPGRALSAEEIALTRMADILAGKQYDAGKYFMNDDPVEWILEHFRIPETRDNHILLADYQQDSLREALSRNENGDFNYSLIVWSDIKKSIKSTIAAAVVLWRAFNTPWASIKIVANDLKQADSRVSFYVRRCIELNERMGAIAHMVPSGYTIDLLHNHARIESIPVDPKGEAGGNDDMVCFSELWAANNKAAQRLWTELTLSPTKYGRSFRWVETYAGYSGESPLLEKLYDQGVKEGKKFDWSEDYDPPLEVYSNKAAKFFCLWNQTPRLSWQTEEYYAQEAATLVPDEFRRVHRNQWVSSVSAFIPIAWWDACKRDNIINRMSNSDSMIMSLDAAVSSDSFGLSMVSGVPAELLKELRKDDGVSDDINYLAVRYARKWTPPKGGKIDFAPIEEEIDKLLKQFHVIEIVYDPYQLEDMAGRIKRSMRAHVYALTQGGPRLKADKGLFDMIRDRRIIHDGTLHDLREHLSNANAEIDKEDKKLRIVKRSELLKIDLAICVSMASARASYWQL
jgi:phage terminase large subunit-like protein